MMLLLQPDFCNSAAFSSDTHAQYMLISDDWQMRNMKYIDSPYSRALSLYEEAHPLWFSKDCIS